MVVDFNISRAKTKNRGRCLLYVGLIIVILNFIGILAQFLSFFVNFRHKSDKRLKDEEMFGAGNITILKCVEILRKGFELAQGALMIQMTKVVVKQISSQESNPNTQIEVWTEKVIKYEKYIACLILANIVNRLCSSMIFFTSMDSFFTTKYEDSYKNWRQSEMEAIRGFKAHPSDDSQQVLQSMEKQEDASLSKIQEFSIGFDTYGPFAIVIWVGMSTCSCLIMFCFVRSYRKHL